MFYRLIYNAMFYRLIYNAMFYRLIYNAMVYILFIVPWSTAYLWCHVLQAYL